VCSEPHQSGSAEPVAHSAGTLVSVNVGMPKNVSWQGKQPVRWSCRTGVCHTCQTTLIAGDLGYNPDPVEPPAQGGALICCSQPTDDVVLDL